MTTPGSESREPLDLLIEEFQQRVRAGDSLTPEGFAKDRKSTRLNSSHRT